jgi:hypothetical protein
MQVENKNFWLNLEKIQNALLKTDEEFSAYLGIEHKLFLKQKTTNSFLPLNCIFECAENLNFHFEDLLNDGFNTLPILNKIRGKHALLERYSIATYSTTVPTGNALNYLQQTRGERAKISLLRKFQLTEEFITNEKSKVNAHLLADIVQYLGKAHQFTNSDLIQVGRMTPLTITNHNFRNALKNQKNIYNLVDFFVNDCAHFFDKNFTYKITNLDQNYATIEATPNHYVLDELGISSNSLGNEEACFTRMGVLSSMTWFKYKTNAKIKKISSLYQGDAANRYLMDISSFKNIDPLPTLYH